MTQDNLNAALPQGKTNSLPSLHNHGGLLTHVYENEETIRVPNGTHGGVRDWDFHLAILPTRLSVGIS